MQLHVSEEISRGASTVLEQHGHVSKIQIVKKRKLVTTRLFEIIILENYFLDSQRSLLVVVCLCPVPVHVERHGSDNERQTKA